MKAAFIHDHIFYEAGGKVYSPGGLPYNVWLRYLEHFPQLIVMGRKGKEANFNIKKAIESSGDHVSFRLHPSYTNPKDYFLHRNKIREPIRKLVEEVDACIIRLPSMLGDLAVQECIRQNKPWAVEVVACAWDSLWNYGNIQGKILAPILYCMNKHYIKQAPYAIYVSKEFLQKRYPCKGITANASNVNIAESEEEVLLKRLEKIKKRDSNKPAYLGLIGSLNVEYKGHEIALQAVKIAKEKGCKVVLRCLGAGDKERWVERCKVLGIEENVEFCGILPSGRPVLEWLDQIDIFIMPSLQEGLPRAMIEAMSRGCPVIGARTGGIPELIDSDFITKPKDYSQLGKLIVQLIEDKTLSCRQAERNFAEAKNYAKQKIDKDRSEFWRSFRASIDK